MNSNRVVLVVARLLVNPRLFIRAATLAPALIFAACAFLLAGAGAASAIVQSVEVQLRSYAPPASGRLVIEPSERGGRVRLIVMSLPQPQTISPYARTYVVWAVSGGRVERIGELRTDRGGNGGLSFDRPASFETYGVVITAERSDQADKPGAPALASRSDAARALYPMLAPQPTQPAPARPDARPRVNPRRTYVRGGGFYAEVDRALESSGGGRLIELRGSSQAPQARARARAAVEQRRAYIRADFTNVPVPSAVGAGVHVLWADLSDGRIVYMGSLPPTEDLNRAEIYVRVADFPSDNFSLFVTAERRRPASAPSGERLLR